MNTLCLFASHFEGNEIPYYIRVYLAELKKQYSTLVLLHSVKNFTDESLRFLQEEKISSMEVENKGFDFGKWHKAFGAVQPETYEQVVLVNDSCVLFKSLDDFANWAKENPADVKGITRSEAIYPHLQSYFLLLNKPAVLLAKKYFEKHGALTTIAEVIAVYEVGMSNYFQENGLKIAAFIDNNGYAGEFSPYYHCIHYHLRQGIPMIKKKIVFSSYRADELFTLARMNFNINWNHYAKILAQQKKLIIDLGKLVQPGERSLTASQRLNYNFRRIFIRILRPVYRLRKAPEN